MACCETCGSNGADVKCQLCASPVRYCSEECALNDWNDHHDDCNVAHVPTLQTNVALPYGYQDLLDEKHFTPADKALYDQAFLVSQISFPTVLATRPALAGLRAKGLCPPN